MDDQDRWSLALDRIVLGKKSFKLHVIMLIRHGLCDNLRLNSRYAKQSQNKKMQLIVSLSPPFPMKSFPTPFPESRPTRGGEITVYTLIGVLMFISGL
jgi:hypothetical protein